MERTYTVQGKWPFPLDMLRRDNARAATPADQVLIDRMSGEGSDPEIGCREKVAINLIMEAGPASMGRPLGQYQPNLDRWESFDWTVTNDPEIDDYRAMRKRIIEDNARHAAAVAKLTSADLAALGLDAQGHSVR